MRLIDADALKELIDVKGANIGITNANRCNFKDMLKMVPTVDAKPARHGHWIYDQHRWICSECHENPTFGMGYVQSKRSLYNYCPNCGAKMDAEVEHEVD